MAHDPRLHNDCDGGFCPTCSQPDTALAPTTQGTPTLPDFAKYPEASRAWVEARGTQGTDSGLAGEGEAFEAMLIEARWPDLEEGVAERILAEDAWKAGKAYAARALAEVAGK